MIPPAPPSRSLGRHSVTSWSYPKPMCVKVTYGSECHIRLRKGDNLLLFLGFRQSTELEVPSFLSVLNVSFYGDRQTQRFEALEDCDFHSESLWTPLDPELLAYLEFLAYRDSLLKDL